MRTYKPYKTPIKVIPKVDVSGAPKTRFGNTLSDYDAQVKTTSVVPGYVCNTVIAFAHSSTHAISSFWATQNTAPIKIHISSALRRGKIPSQEIKSEHRGTWDFGSFGNVNVRNQHFVNIAEQVTSVFSNLTQWIIVTGARVRFNRVICGALALIFSLSFTLMRFGKLPIGSFHQPT